MKKQWLWQHAPSVDVIPALAQVHLLGRRSVPLKFQSGGVSLDGAFSVMLGRLIFKGGLPLCPLNRVAEISLVVATASAKLRLNYRHRTPSGYVGVLHATLEGAYAQF